MPLEQSSFPATKKKTTSAYDMALSKWYDASGNVVGTVNKPPDQKALYKAAKDRRGRTMKALSQIKPPSQKGAHRRAKQHRRYYLAPTPLL